MKGTVLDFSIEKSSGVISGSDGKRSKFVVSSWMQEQPPYQGMKVDFDIDEEGQAVEIYADLDFKNSTSLASAKNFSNDVMQKVEEFKKSDIGQRLGFLFKGGLHNRFIVSLSQ